MLRSELYRVDACAYCNGKRAGMYLSNRVGARYHVRCPDCGAHGREDDDPERACKYWNELARKMSILAGMCPSLFTEYSEGWGWPLGDNQQHYIASDSRSLCHQQVYVGTPPGGQECGDTPGPNQCYHCHAALKLRPKSKDRDDS